MPKKNQPPVPVKPVITPPVETDEPVVQETNDPDIIPDDDEFTTPPYEAPEPGEGP